MKKNIIYVLILLTGFNSCKNTNEDGNYTYSEQYSIKEKSDNILLERMMIGEWVYNALPLIGATDENVLDSTYLHFIPNKRIVLGSDTLNIRIHNENYIKIMVKSETDPNTVKWDFHILDATDSTLKVEFFIGKDILEFKKLK